MLLDNRINAFIQLGDFLKQFSRDKISKHENIPHNELFFDVFEMLINRAQESNGWFTKDNVLFSIESWAKALTKENFEKWLGSYQFDTSKEKTIAVIMAGNIPLVGFHDFLSVLISGHKVKAKLSSNDKKFLPLIAKYLEYVQPEFKGKIVFTEEKLENFDAVIATGSDNTARYFDYYFGKHPHIIRKNRNTVAVLSGDESHETLERMTDDVFRYFGLGCRSISKIFIPKGFDLDRIFKAAFKHKDILQYDRYANNYDYNKAVYLMSLFDIRENGFLMLKEDASYASPISSLFYEYYEDLEEIQTRIANDSDKIQCVTSDIQELNAIPLGETQNPQLWDYADGVDTLQFLLTFY
ncbi:aldehyde dehydrogenase family protein [Flavicella marina]|uniref:acyl-CoA reductase n=1 Tax=Flavicella marina TaxID=1475951 RepID=UPI001264C4D4|nr:acyl-CoA reductase [Flavicella marina]